MSAAFFGRNKWTEVVLLIIVLVATTFYSIAVLQNLLVTSQELLCHQECLPIYLTGSPGHKDPDFIETVRSKFLWHPPALRDNAEVDVNAYIWKDLSDWNTIQNNLIELWRNQPSGTFVEVGAVDGEFMSQTLLLERKLNWKGLLIEPDPRAFKLLKEKRRNAIITDFCIQPLQPGPEPFWMHNLVSDLPQQYITLMMARSRLASSASTQELRHGKFIYVKCAPLSSLLLASNLTQVDLLTISTGTLDDRRKITDVLGDNDLFDIKTLLISFTRDFLAKNPYPEVPGYIYDMSRSTLLVRFYWKKSICHLEDKSTCERQHYYDLMDSCFKYLCQENATVWYYQ